MKESLNLTMENSEPSTQDKDTVLVELILHFQMEIKYSEHTKEMETVGPFWKLSVLVLQTLIMIKNQEKFLLSKNIIKF